MKKAGIIWSAVTAGDDATVVMAGTDIHDDLHAWGRSYVRIDRGVVGRELRVVNHARIVISGGCIGLGGPGASPAYILDQGILEIHGSGFEIDGVPVAFGEYDAPDPPSVGAEAREMRTLTSSFAPHHPLSMIFPLASDSRAPWARSPVSGRIPVL